MLLAFMAIMPSRLETMWMVRVNGSGAYFRGCGMVACCNGLALDEVVDFQHKSSIEELHFG
jgi:hypothetical protein